jgi:hypothetical protein
MSGGEFLLDIQARDVEAMDVRSVKRYIRFFSDQGNTMRMWIGGLALAMLAGCSLPASLVPGEPNLSKVSAKAPKDYAACVLPLWQHDVPKTTQTSISNGYRITAPSVITADEILDVVKYKDGSRVSLYQGPPWAKSASLRKSLRDCL